MLFLDRPTRNCKWFILFLTLHQFVLLDFWNWKLVEIFERESMMFWDKSMCWVLLVVLSTLIFISSGTGVSSVNADHFSGKKNKKD